MMNDIVYFELNDWFEDEFYPAEEPFQTWFDNEDYHICFCDEKWVKDNRLCVVKDIIDMSVNFCVTATKTWVEENCPRLLTEHRRFLRYPDENGCVKGQWGNIFLKYSDENIGITNDNLFTK